MNKHTPLDALKVVLFLDACFRPDFPRYLTKHWRSIREFFSVADEQWKEGVRANLSARNIAECIRNMGHKIDGNFVPDVAELYECLYPERTGLFSKRRRRGPMKRKK